VRTIQPESLLDPQAALLDDTTGLFGALASSVDRTMERRNFLKLAIVTAVASIGLPASAAAEVERVVVAGKKKPSVIWLHFQECTGCTESLLRTSHPPLDELIVDLISLDYHETLFAAAGHQVEAARRDAMKANAGKYVLVVEGAIPTKDGGIYCKIGGQTAQQMLEECAAHAGAIIAIGSCASWGGIPSVGPNPTEAKGAGAVLQGKTVVTIPGCPANPYNLLGTVLQYATYGTLPKLDSLGRPIFAYGRTIHDDCPRRPHFDAGRFAQQFGDEGHRKGYCLYKLGCKGPVTHANCSLQHFCEVQGAWPIGIGHPCVGCTEQGIAFTVPMHDTVQIARPTPPDTYAPVQHERGIVSPMATGLAGAIVGGVAVAATLASRKLHDGGDAGTPTPTPPPRITATTAGD
jgi:hydrogenase small subunit